MAHITKMIFAERNDRYEEEFNKLKSLDLVHITDYGTCELSTDDIRTIEDDVQTIANCTEGEGLDLSQMATMTEKMALQEILGFDEYDQILNGDIDLVLFVYEV